MCVLSCVCACIVSGHGDHLDLLVLALLTAFQSLLGLPWLCAATVRSINHVKALHVYASDRSASTATAAADSTAAASASTEASASASGLAASGVSSGSVVVGTVEQRLSGFLIHGIIGVVVVGYRPLLRAVPKPALSGLFFYLGQSALRGNQMFERCVALLTDPALDPPGKPWARCAAAANRPGIERSGGIPGGGVPPPTVLAYTLVQVACLVCLVAVKDNSIAGVLFPVVVACLAPLRCALPALGAALNRLQLVACHGADGHRAAGTGGGTALSVPNIFDFALVARLDLADE